MCLVENKKIEFHGCNSAPKCDIYVVKMVVFAKICHKFAVPLTDILCCIFE